MENAIKFKNTKGLFKNTHTRGWNRKISFSQHSFKTTRMRQQQISGIRTWLSEI